jgi:hypothetical protein
MDLFLYIVEVGVGLAVEGTQAARADAADAEAVDMDARADDSEAMEDE